MSAKIHKLEDHAEKDKYKALITTTKNTIKTETHAFMAKIFDDVDDVLFKTAEKAITSTQQNELFDTMRMLRIERSTIISNYIKRINNRITTPQVIENDSFNADELSLVSQDEMEEMVAISSITNRSDTIHAEAISHLQARIDHLILQTKNIFDKNSLLPKNFCEDFLSASSHIELNTNAKLIFLKVFGKHIDEYLQNIYTTINYRFIEADILPQIKLNAPKHERKKYVNEQYYNLASTDTLPSELQQTGSNNSQDIQQVIQNYIQSNIPNNAVTQINEQNFYDRNHIVGALSKLQTKFSQTAQPINFDLIKQALLTSINSGSGGMITRQVNHVDEKTIEVIEYLFKEILDDDNLTNAVRTLVLRLQIPTVKVAMLDQQFFNNPNHPARVFLNTLSHIGIGITDDDDRLLAGIEVIIDNLLSDYDNDSVSFQQALDSLNQIFNKEQTNCKKKEQLTQQQILREHARKIVLAELQTQANGKNIAKKIEPLVLKLWPTQMYQQYIKFGKDSDQWNESVSTLKLIISSIQKPTSLKELQHIVNRQDDIMQLIQDKLYESKQDIESINLSIYTLSELYLELINSADFEDPEENNFTSFSLETFSGSFNDIQDIDTDLDAANTHEPLLPQSQPQTLVKDKREQLQLLPKEVKPGMWFELFDGDNKPARRLKLSVIIMEEAQLIFVNRQGVKILEKNAEVFAKELEQETSKIIADHSIFDQALTNVITALSNKTG